MKLFLRVWLLLLAAVFFTACGGGGSDGDPTIGPGDDGGGTDGGDTDDGSVTSSTVRFGSFSGEAFTVGQIASNQAELDAGESATLSVALVDEAGNPVATQTTPTGSAISVQFSSNCIVAGQAEISPNIATINSNGRANATYTARGCEGTDTVTALTSVNLTSYSAKVDINTVSSPLGSISFESATPNIIGLKGSGAIPEQSKVSFRVSNATGGPVPDLEVSFSLDNTAGGISISNETALTDANGIASTTVASGSVATAVRVTANATKDGISTSAQSSALVVTTGIADNDSFSISASELNIEGYEYDNIKTTINILAADRYNNPVPDGTAITFQAEGGAVQGSCQTEAGSCSVEFRSQNPRPANGRITILATAIGEETFTDSNPSNGFFDENESFQDLAEAFRDDNENGLRDADEPYVNFNQNPDGTGGFDLGNGKFDGLLCTGKNEVTTPDYCSESSTVHVRNSITIVLSGSSFNVEIVPGSINLDSGIQTVEVFVVDNQGQVPPSGTTIVATTTQGSIQGPSTYIQASTTKAGPAKFEFKVAPGENPGNGLFSVSVTTPKNIISRDSVNVVQNTTP